MDQKYYPAHCVDSLVKIAGASFEALEFYSDTVDALNADNKVLKQQLDIAKSATFDKIELEKVAKANPFADEVINDFVDLCIAGDLIDPAVREKCAALCKQDPNAVLELARNAITLSEPSTAQGHAVKKASTSSREEDDEYRLWLKSAAL